LQYFNIAEILHSITLHSVTHMCDGVECDGVERVMELNVLEWMCDGVVWWSGDVKVLQNRIWLFICHYIHIIWNT